MESRKNEIVDSFTEEFIILLEAKTVEEALYGLIAYLHNGLRILDEVLSHFDNNQNPQ